MAGHGRRVIRPEDKIPIDGVVSAKWRDLVVEKDSAGGFQINRINYEICVTTALRERLRCKEIWVVGADRYRNPDEDLPQDFQERRADYYRDLGRSQDAQALDHAVRPVAGAARSRGGQGGARTPVADDGSDRRADGDRAANRLSERVLYFRR
ncbi:hypothetical protein [Mesorhizobium sp. M0800]|uniref:hypothetical protein n=1 Tax=Mesorhizobium sp. M0800 TaxID=2957000 RepID=UPI003339EA40